MKKNLRAIALLATGIMAFTGIAGCGNKYDRNFEGIETASIGTKASVHDPSIVHVGDTYYIFGSHMAAASSKDLRDWKMITNGYSVTNKVFTDMKNYDSGEFVFTGNKVSAIPTDDGEYHVWAPDIFYNEKLGKYFMYYCTSSNFNSSTLVYGVADSIEGPYEWQGNLLYSGFSKSNIDKTDVLDYMDEETALSTYASVGSYDYKKYPNCIDPTVFYDKDGKVWMVYGSWSGGIFLLEIDENTGKVIHPQADPDNDVDVYFGKRLLGGGHKSIEAPYILWDEESGYYYLYVSYGELTREGGYQIRVFRSESVDGPYVDMNGNKPDAKTSHDFTGLKLSGNYYMPSLEVAYMATGHNSAMIDEDGKRYVAYHTRFDAGSEMHSPRVKQYFLNKEGWPCLLPYCTYGETISETGYSTAEVAGVYYMLNQDVTISSEIAEPFAVELKKNGTLEGKDLDGADVSGTWSMEEGTYYMQLTYNDVEYSGVFCQMEDEARTDVMTFSAVGNNESIWGVKYNK